MAEGQGPRVVVVEDDVGKRYTIVHALVAAGFAVQEAATGEAGLALIDADTDVVVLDIKLPDVDGYEVCRRIKADKATAGVMVLELSAVFAKPADRARGLELGADAYLVHPVEGEELVASVRALWRLRRAERDRSMLAGQRDLLLATLGHDLRNPLNVLQLGTDKLLESPRLDPSEMRTVQQMQSSIVRMQRLIEDLLVFARSEVEGVPLTRAPTRLAEVCAEVIRDARLRHPDRQIELEDELRRMVDVDPARIEQVVENLVSNALRHGDGPVQVRIGREGVSAVIAVHNGGKPIDPALVPTLFEPFRRASGRSGGVGLGLYIVDRLTRAHGGTVTVNSSAQDGTTFRVVLPID